MYGLLQAELLAQELLQQRLTKQGYTQSKQTPGLWRHHTQPITFCLMVDDFGVKKEGPENTQHLHIILSEAYKITTDWTGRKHIGLTLEWDYINC